MLTTCGQHIGTTQFSEFDSLKKQSHNQVIFILAVQSNPHYACVYCTIHMSSPCIIRGVLTAALAVTRMVKFLCFQLLLSQLVDAAFF